MLKLHKLFLNDGHTESFDEKIPPNETQRRTLVAAKNAIRDRLRDRIRAASTTVLGMAHAVSPRFRTQGSWAYKTCVQAAHRPPQEMDWDFGVYLPVAVWADNGPPAPMAKLYFELVEKALLDLCDEQGWTLIRDKPRCVRVKIAAWAHIDVPLYAASETEFRQVVEKGVATANFSTSASIRESAALEENADFGEMPEAFWERMEGIYLALRNGTWKESDPEAVALWFNDRVEEHGPQLRRICRYLKAWRDFLWPNGDGPSSVALMIAIAQDFQAKPRRDDLALEHAARSLARALAGDLREPAIDGSAEDFNRLKPEARRAAAARANELATKLQAIRGYSFGLRQDAINTVIQLLGPRIPNDLSFVETDDGADVVRSTPALAVPPPKVNATKAG